MTIEAQLAGLLTIGDNWNGERSPAPSTDAVAAVTAILGTLTDAGLTPYSAGPDAEGGAGLWFASPQAKPHRTAWLYRTNADWWVAMLTDHDDKTAGGVLSTNGPPASIIEAVAKFLRGGEPPHFNRVGLPT